MQALSLRRFGCALLLSSAATLCAAAATASVSVFHSPADDGVRASGPLEIPVNSTRVLSLWVEKGGTTSSSGVVCESAGGDEICAYDVRILLVGDVSIEGWSADDVDVMGAPSLDGTEIWLNSIVASPAASAVHSNQTSVSTALEPKA